MEQFHVSVFRKMVSELDIMLANKKDWGHPIAMRPRSRVDFMNTIEPHNLFVCVDESFLYKSSDFTKYCFLF